MWFTIVAVVVVGWSRLPEITVMLEFCAALINFIITMPLLVHCICRWSRSIPKG